MERSPVINQEHPYRHYGGNAARKFYRLWWAAQTGKRLAMALAAAYVVGNVAFYTSLVLHSKIPAASNGVAASNVAGVSTVAASQQSSVCAWGYKKPSHPDPKLALSVLDQCDLALIAAPTRQMVEQAATSSKWKRVDQYLIGARTQLLANQKYRILLIRKNDRNINAVIATGNRARAIIAKGGHIVLVTPGWPGYESPESSPLKDAGLIPALNSYANTPSGQQIGIWIDRGLYKMQRETKPLIPSSREVQQAFMDRVARTWPVMIRFSGGRS